MRNLILFLFLPVMIICWSCTGDPQNFHANIADSTDKEMKPKQIIAYPFIYIDKEREEEKEIRNYNEMMLYECENKPNADTIAMFCSEQKAKFTDGIFHILVFFDDTKNAVFPNNPITAYYNDSKPMKHIKAIYTFNKLNGYSKLDFYTKNAYEGRSKEIEIH